jgi:hypothetical protein
MFMGEELVPDNIISSWKNIKNDEFPNLREVELKIIQGSRNKEVDQFKYVNELYETKKAELLSKDERIKVLEKDLIRLEKLSATQIPFQDISAEAKSNYENLASLSYSYTITTDFQKMDTIPVFEAKWKNGTSNNQAKKDSKKLIDWLRLRLKNDQIQLK